MSKIDLCGQYILVNHAGSMLGREIVKVLKNRQAIVIELFHSKDSKYKQVGEYQIECNLLNLDHCNMIFQDFKIDMLVNGIGINGGIGYNTTNCADIFGETLYMNINMLSGAAAHKVSKVVSLISSCAYAPSDLPLLEKNFLSGECHTSVLAHGMARRNIFLYGRFLHKQYKLNHVSVVMNNCYGYAPFDREYKLKVCDGLISRMIQAKYNNDKEFVVWGTGMPLRELLFCEDAGEGIVKTLELYEDNNEVLNIGNGQETTIHELSSLIKELVEFDGDIVFDTAKPDGQMKKLLDNTKMKQVLQWEPQTSLRNGIIKTIEYYTNNYMEKSLVSTSA